MIPGYSHDAIRRNINELLTSGVVESIARYRAICFARKLFFKKFPHGAIPLYLAYGQYRLRECYDRNGEPITRDMFENEKQNKTSIEID